MHAEHDLNTHSRQAHADIQQQERTKTGIPKHADKHRDTE